MEGRVHDDEVELGLRGVFRGVGPVRRPVGEAFEVLLLAGEGAMLGLEQGHAFDMLAVGQYFAGEIALASAKVCAFAVDPFRDAVGQQFAACIHAVPAEQARPAPQGAIVHFLRRVEGDPLFRQLSVPGFCLGRPEGPAFVL